MTQIQIINSAVGMFAGFIIAMILGRDPPLFLYSLIFAAGIGTGVFSGLLLKKLPEPPSEAGGVPVKLSGVVKEAFSHPSLRLFIAIFFLVALSSGIARTFIIVYSREVFSQSDGMVSLYAVFGSLGNLMIGLLIKLLVDRVGAKPLFMVCVLTALVSMTPIIFFPAAGVDNFTSVTLFLTFIFFILNFGFLGAENIAQTYFLGLVPGEKTMDMGILYFFVFGVAGALGSFLGGLLLDGMRAVEVTTFWSFKILYFLMIGITAVVLFLQRRLVSLGALSFKNTLGVMFSLTDLKAISLLDRLGKTSDSGEEAALLEALHDTPSNLAIAGLLQRARSPRLAVRQESLRAIDALKELNEDAETALMDDMIHNPYTTANLSARILGNHGVFAAVPLLRELTSSGDYMLAGEAMIALAKLGDEAFRPQIERIIVETSNPRLKIMGVEAFGIYGSANSLTPLLDILKGADPPPYLRDEVILAMAEILHVQNQFYPLLVRFLENPSLLPALAQDEAESACEAWRSGRKSKKDDSPEAKALAKQAKALGPAVAAFVKESRGEALAEWILRIPTGLADGIAQGVLSEAVLDDVLVNHPRLKLLAAHWTASELTAWAKGGR